jgi:hypothetical protein
MIGWQAASIEAIVVPAISRKNVRRANRCWTLTRSLVEILRSPQSC